MKVKISRNVRLGVNGERCVVWAFSRMSSGVLEDVYDCMCMCVTTMKVMNVIEFFCKENGYRVKEVS